MTTRDAILGGVALAGIAVVSKFFIELSEKETELGTRLDKAARREVWLRSLPTAAFPFAAVLVLAFPHPLDRPNVAKAPLDLPRCWHA